MEAGDVFFPVCFSGIEMKKCFSELYVNGFGLQKYLKVEWNEKTILLMLLYSGL